jgi:hypothetical protein
MGQASKYFQSTLNQKPNMLNLDFDLKETRRIANQMWEERQVEKLEEEIGEWQSDCERDGVFEMES